MQLLIMQHYSNLHRLHHFNYIIAAKLEACSLLDQHYGIANSKINWLPPFCYLCEVAIKKVTS